MKFRVRNILGMPWVAEQLSASQDIYWDICHYYFLRAWDRAELCLHSPLHLNDMIIRAKEWFPSTYVYEIRSGDLKALRAEEMRSPKPRLLRCTSPCYLTVSVNVPVGLDPTVLQKQECQVIRDEEHLFVQFQWTALSNIPNKNRIINDMKQSGLLDAGLLRP